MFICCSNCLFIWAYQSLYIQCTMQMTKLDPTIMNRPDGFLLPIKFDLGRSVHHVRRVVGVFSLHHKHWALFKNSTREISPSCACFSNKQTDEIDHLY